MEIQNINTKLERKGLFQEIFQNLTKQSFPKSDSKSKKQNISPSTYNKRKMLLRNIISLHTYYQFEDSSVFDKQTKLRLQEVLSNHKSNLMKQKLSATLLKIDSSMPNLAGETSRDSYGIFRFQLTKFHSVFSIVFQFYTHFYFFCHSLLHRQRSGKIFYSTIKKILWLVSITRLTFMSLLIDILFDFPGDHCEAVYQFPSRS